MKDLQTIRDEIALMLGCERHADGCIYASRDDYRFPLHGHPCPSTLDGIAALWPKGWTWQRLCDGNWVATKTNNINDFVEVEDSGDELADRTRLLHAVLTEMKGIK